MIRAACIGRNGRKMILLGLEEGNVTRLREGKPIHIHADDMGFAGEIVIILGKDAAELKKTLGPLINADTAIRDETQRLHN